MQLDRLLSGYKNSAYFHKPSLACLKWTLPSLHLKQNLTQLCHFIDTFNIKRILMTLFFFIFVFCKLVLLAIVVILLSCMAIFKFLKSSSSSPIRSHIIKHFSLNSNIKIRQQELVIIIINHILVQTTWNYPFVTIAFLMFIIVFNPHSIMMSGRHHYLFAFIIQKSNVIEWLNV
jgi:hypothetical protein